MILPDLINPKYSLYYCGALVLRSLQGDTKVPVLDLYMRINADSKMEYSLFLLSMDWLYLMGKVKIENDNQVSVCL